MYRKLVNYLLDDAKMRLANPMDDHYTRSLNLHVSREQRDKFRTATDLRDIDGLLSDILHQSRTGTMEQMAQSWSESIADAYAWIVNQRYLSNLAVVGVAVGCWLFSRRFNFNVIYVALLVIAFYIYQYLDAECQRVIYCTYRHGCQRI